MFKDSFKIFFKRFMKPYIISLILIFVLGFSTLLFSFTSPLLIRALVDQVFIGKMMDLFFYIIIGIIGMYIISATSSYFNSYIAGKLTLLLLKDVSEELFNIIQLASLKNSQTIKVGDMITRIMGNTQIAINIPVRILPQFYEHSKYYCSFYDNVNT
ncbi:MAG: hypothetical protein PHY59_04170 [Methanobacterium sp.]|nr:hypothetical protein [Methanobacterium sp.]